MNKDCEELEKKYDQVVKMLKNSFILYSHEISKYKSEKDKRNASIVAYKKRVSEHIQELQNSIDSQEKIIDYYKKQNLELTRENILLKKKFKKAASSFTKNKENNLLYKYFKEDIEIEDFLHHVVNKILKEKFNPKNITPLFFRKELYNVLNRYFIKELILYTKIEKMAILLASILMNRFNDKIYFLIASFFVERIVNETYRDFIKILLTKTLVDKDKKYEPIKMEYSVDDIKIIYNKYKKLAFKKDDLLIKIDLEKVDKDISNCLEQIDKNEKELEELTNEENDILMQLTNSDEENKEEIKKELDNIDSQKRIIVDNISKLKKELELLENKKMFLQPANEVVFDNSLKDVEKEIVEEYNKMLNSFAFALEKALK